MLSESELASAVLGGGALSAPVAALPGAVAAPGAVGPLMVMLAAGFVLAFLLGAAGPPGRDVPAGGLPAGRRDPGPVHAGVRRGHRRGPGTVGDRRDPADVRRRAALLLPRPAVGAGASPSRGPSSQIAAATAMGVGAGPEPWAGVAPPASVFGLSLSVASTVVLLRALQERRLLGGAPAAASRSGGSSSRTSRWSSRWS